MAHNTKEIIELIGKRPGIRLVEISDAVDCDPEQVLWALTDQLLDGSVIKAEVKAPNGHMQPSFTLRDQPKVELDPVKVHTPLIQKTKVQLALDYLATVDTADDVAMRKAMGLPIGGNVRAYIATQLQKRQIVQVVGGYKLGDGKPLSAPPVEVTTPEPVVRAITPEVLQAVDAKLAAAGAKPAAKDFGKLMQDVADAALFHKAMANHKPILIPTFSTPVQAQAFRCAVWSDNGAMTLMRGGLEVITLTAEELKILRTYMEHTCTVRDGVKV